MNNYYTGYNYPQNTGYNYPQNYNDNRLIGGFAFPFLLGGVTGAAIAPAFWRPPYNRPYPSSYGPYYGPYYRSF